MIQPVYSFLSASAKPMSIFRIFITMLIYQFTVYPHAEEWKQYLTKLNLGE